MEGRPWSSASGPLNLFLHDVYHERRILREGVIPEDLVLKSKGYRPEMIGFNPPGKQYIHVVGTDLIRDADGQFLVLEDNAAAARPGVSYVLENRLVMKKVFPELFQQCRVRRIEDYPQRLREALLSVAPQKRPAIRPALCCSRRGLTTPFAYGAHSFLARHMGDRTGSQGPDFFVGDEKVFLETAASCRSAWTSSIGASTKTEFPRSEGLRAPDFSFLGVPGLMSGPTERAM